MESLSLHRIKILLKRDTLFWFLPVIKSFATVMLVFVIINILNYIFSSNPKSESDDYFMAYCIVFFVFSGVLAIKSFQEMTQASTRAEYLVLPASHLEKIVSKWLISTLGFALVGLICYSIGYGIIKVIASGYFNKPMEQYFFWSKDYGKLLSGSIIASSILFFASINWNNNSFFKLLGWSLLILLGLFVFNFLVGMILFPEMRDGLFGLHDNSDNSLNLRDVNMDEFWIVKMLEFIFKYLTAPFFWFMAWLKLREKEV